ncbi:MAG: glycerol-3-phosphate acyltransferase [Paenibacillaceae bacterium]|nr:glycerol-3-phosphate acyltransferase [Paenibacillaceae bacterium]
MNAIWTVVSFLSGACMFSYWLGRLARTNLRTVGDGNPGARNLWASRGYRFGLAGVALDFAKGYLPVWLYLAGGGETTSVWFVPVALAPIAGHAFSPFLGFRGGKAIAVTFGVWSAASLAASLVYAVVLAVLLIAGRALNKGQPVSSAADGAQVVGGLLLLIIFLAARGDPAPVLGLWFGNLALLAYTHRRELRRAFAGAGRAR